MQYLVPENDTFRTQQFFLKDFEHPQLWNWLKALLTNNSEQLTIRLSRISKEWQDHINFKDNIFSNFFISYLKLISIQSRNSIIKILNYLNVFRGLQKNLVNMNKKEKESEIGNQTLEKNLSKSKNYQDIIDNEKVITLTSISFFFFNFIFIFKKMMSTIII